MKTLLKIIWWLLLVWVTGSVYWVSFNEGPYTTDCAWANKTINYYLPIWTNQRTVYPIDSFTNNVLSFILSADSSVSLFKNWSNVLDDCTDWQRWSNVGPVWQTVNAIWNYDGCVMNRQIRQNPSLPTFQLVFKVAYKTQTWTWSGNSSYYYYPQAWENILPIQYIPNQKQRIWSAARVHDNECLNVNVNYCWDWILHSSQWEQCDDGNNVDGDWCSAICESENLAQCVRWPITLPLSSTITASTSGLCQPWVLVWWFASSIVWNAINYVWSCWWSAVGWPCAASYTSTASACTRWDITIPLTGIISSTTPWLCQTWVTVDSFADTTPVGNVRNYVWWCGWSAIWNINGWNCLWQFVTWWWSECVRWPMSLPLTAPINASHPWLCRAWEIVWAFLETPSWSSRNYTWSCNGYIWWTCNATYTSGWGNSYCWDGTLDPWEQCDDGNNVDWDWCSATCRRPWSSWGWGWWGVPTWTYYCGDGNLNPWEDCDDGNKIDWDGCNKSCDREPWVTFGEIPKCSEIDPPSVLLWEYLPVFWKIKSIDNINSCKDSNVWMIKKSSSRCYFKISNKFWVADEFYAPCYGWNWWNLWNDFFKTINSQTSNIDWKLLRKIDESYKNKKLWEYKITLYKIEYDQCVEVPWEETQYVFKRKSYKWSVCAMNFIITTPYLLQQWATISTSSNATLSNFYRMNGKSMLSNLELANIKVASLSWWETKDYLLNTFVTKYKKLAVVNTKLNNITMKKVSDRNIYYYNWSINLNNVKFVKPTTIIIDWWDVNIKWNVTWNVMFIVPQWSINISSSNCDIKQVIDGIYVAKNYAIDIIRNNNKYSTWCNDWRVQINWLLIGWNSENLWKYRRSVLNDYFYGWASIKKKVFDGASMLINQNPSMWLSLPPGANELMDQLKVKRN